MHRFLTTPCYLALLLATSVLQPSRVSGNPPRRDQPALLEFCDWRQHDPALLRDLEDGQLHQHALLDAALVAGGRDPEDAKRLVDAFRARAPRLPRVTQLPQGSPGMPSTHDVVHLFDYLHRNHLQGEYQAELCDVGQTISKQKFNCLTATILFQALCRDSGIATEAIWEPAHVRCWVHCRNDLGYLVETTAESTALAVSPRMRRGEVAARSLSSEQLLGKVFYNRGVQLLRKNAFAPALSATWTSCRLDGDDRPAHNNLRACINNWALSVSQHRGDLAQAVRLLDAGLQLDPDYEPFSRNLRLLRGHDPGGVPSNLGIAN